MSEEHSGVPGLSKARLEALTDGIFATVMTILVLSLSVPVITGPLSSSQLASEVLVDVEGLAPNILGYVMSFLLLITFWISITMFSTTSPRLIVRCSGSTPPFYSRSASSRSQPPCWEGTLWSSCPW